MNSNDDINDGVPMDFGDGMEYLRDEINRIGAAPAADSNDTPNNDLNAELLVSQLGSRDGDVSSDEVRSLFAALATIEDEARCEILIGQAAKKTRGLLTKEFIRRGVAGVRAENAGKKKMAEATAKEEALRRVAVNPAALIQELQMYFAERAFYPQGAALILAFFVLNSGTFHLFDTVPYINLESAVPECGKSTTLDLLKAVIENSYRVTSMTESTLFRIIDKENPVLMVDEAETLENRSERSEILRAIVHEGYRVGGKVPRTEGEGEDRHVVFYDVYCPKVFAEIGGLSGALLSRCIVIHMERAPKDHVRKSTRQRALRREAKRLVPMLEAYALQMRDALRGLYEAEPDEGYWPVLGNREAELWGPLLIHARLAGKATENELLKVVAEYGKSKSAMQATDYRIAQAIDLLEALRVQREGEFSPADVLPDLETCESWVPRFSKHKGEDGKPARAAAVGRFLCKYRLQARKSKGVMLYRRLEAIEKLQAHIPQNPPQPPQAPSLNPPHEQMVSNSATSEDRENREVSATGAREKLRSDNRTPLPSCPRCGGSALYRDPDGTTTCLTCEATEGKA